MAKRELEELGRAGLERAGGAPLARAVLAGEQVGVLSTLSLRYPGWPFGSLVPYALSARGGPLFAISALAQHTRNLEADPRATMLVFDGAAAAHDPRSTPRVILVGRARRVLPEEEEEGLAQFLGRHPRATGLFALDFALWTLVIEEAQVIGGFGAAAFLSAEELLAP